MNFSNMLCCGVDNLVSAGRPKGRGKLHSPDVSRLLASEETHLEIGT
jgi:hypothetical protein